MRNFRRREIAKHCLLNVDDYRSLGDCEDTIHGPLIHIDNGSKILGVAHLDAVGFDSPTWKNTKVTCAQLDDRLGVWVLLELLPQLGCPTFDVLLTDSEECGQSTAQFFNKDQYNWVFEFDRAGSDCVLYDYEDEDTISIVEQYGWKVGFGAFSDICFLEHLSVKCFNFGTGYHMQHTQACYADIGETIASAKKFVRFAQDLQEIHLPHEQQPNTPSQWWNDNDSDCEYCEECYNELDHQWLYCPWCGAKASQWCQDSQSENIEIWERYNA